MVDEYQDINRTKFMLISLLSDYHKNLFVVGDDDQSIYGFRDADIQNVLNSQNQYPSAKVINLEENYRSTSNILNTANAVIQNNESRSEKTLWTQNHPGEKVEHKEFRDANEEVNDISLDVLSGSFDYPDVAIIYRLNSQSRL